MTDTLTTGKSPIERWARPERVFAVIALVFGHALVVTIPPFQSADEPYHLLRAYEITEGVLIHRQVDARGIAAGYLPVSLYKIWLPFSHLGFHPERRASVSDIREALRVPLNSRERIFVTFPGTAHFSPVCYLPQCLGIILGRVLGAPPLAMLYLGREFNLLFWTLLAYWAMRSCAGDRPSVAADSSDANVFIRCFHAICRCVDQCVCGGFYCDDLRSHFAEG